MSWAEIDGHQRPWAASRLGQGIAPPRRPRSGGVTAAPQTPTPRRRRPCGKAVTRICRLCPCEVVPRCCVPVFHELFRGTLFLSLIQLHLNQTINCCFYPDKSFKLEFNQFCSMQITF